MGGITPDAATEVKVATVTERANARWQALIAGDMGKAYGYLSPAAREVTTLDQYKARVNPSMYRQAKVDEVRCEAEVCTVRLTLTYDHRLMKGIQTPMQESWVLDKGQFWFVYRG